MSHYLEEIIENWHSKPITVRVKHSGSPIWLKVRVTNPGWDILANGFGERGKGESFPHFPFPKSKSIVPLMTGSQGQDTFCRNASLLLLGTKSFLAVETDDSIGNLGDAKVICLNLKGVRCFLQRCNFPVAVLEVAFGKSLF